MINIRPTRFKEDFDKIDLLPQFTKPNEDDLELLKSGLCYTGYYDKYFIKDNYVIKGDYKIMYIAALSNFECIICKKCQRTENYAVNALYISKDCKKDLRQLFEDTDYWISFIKEHFPQLDYIYSLADKRVEKSARFLEIFKFKNMNEVIIDKNNDSYDLFKYLLTNEKKKCNICF